MPFRSGAPAKEKPVFAAVGLTVTVRDLGSGVTSYGRRSGQLSGGRMS